MAKINSKETKYYTLRVTNKLVSEQAIWMIGELTRLHAKKKIQLDPKSYEGLPENDDDIPMDDDWSVKEWDNYWESIEEIQSKKHDISLANGAFTTQEAHLYRDNYFK